MSLKLRFAFVLILVCLSSAHLSGCSGADIDESDPAALMKDAEEDIENDHYQIALDKLRIVKNKFPYSKYATQSALRIADVYFLQESFAEAAAAYESFRDLHPKHERAGYAMFRLAKSYFNDMPGNIARDMTSGQKALEAYNEYLRRFPSEANAEEARKDLSITRNALAEKELYIAEFYYKRDFNDSARPRYRKVVELYPETEAAKEANTKLEKIGRTDPPKKTEEEPAANGG